MLKWLLLVNAVTALVLMSVMFFAARSWKRLDVADLAWPLFFVLVASITAGYEWQLRTVLVAVLVDIWAVRLLSHLAERSRRRKDDPRYLQLSKKWKPKFGRQAYIKVFLLPAALAWVVSLPIAAASGKSTHLALLFTLLGVLVWAKGFAVETIADRQLAFFTSDSANIGKVLQTGLWRYSRHPNYYGEITQWLGIAFIACAAEHGWIGLLSPMALTLSLIYISGIPPIEKRRSSDLGYQEYKRRTSPLIPWRHKED